MIDKLLLISERIPGNAGWIRHNYLHNMYFRFLRRVVRSTGKMCQTQLVFYLSQNFSISFDQVTCSYNSFRNKKMRLRYFSLRVLLAWASSVSEKYLLAQTPFIFHLGILVGISLCNDTLAARALRIEALKAQEIQRYHDQQQKQQNQRALILDSDDEEVIAGGDETVPLAEKKDQ